jgi:uncharacterized lipoprotein NlpE involved in copper resistance
MHTLIKHTNKKLILFFFSILFSASYVMAATDMEAQDSFLRAKVKSRQQEGDHANHAQAPIDKSLDFHGVFYGYLPCNGCNGIKTTLSLKQNNNYLLVTQPAKDSSREFYEKGKYTWDEETHSVVLTPRKEASPRQFLIKDEGTLVQLNSDGTPMSEELTESYTLRRSDTVKSREVHIH